jgi:hypothetical protein
MVVTMPRGSDLVSIHARLNGSIYTNFMKHLKEFFHAEGE